MKFRLDSRAVGLVWHPLVTPPPPEPSEGWGAGARAAREVEGRGGALWYEVPH